MSRTVPCAEGYKPTTDQVLAAWLDSRPLKTWVEKAEMEVGFYEWLEEEGGY